MCGQRHFSCSVEFQNAGTIKDLRISVLPFEKKQLKRSGGMPRELVGVLSSSCQKSNLCGLSQENIGLGNWEVQAEHVPGTSGSRSPRVTSGLSLQLLASFLPAIDKTCSCCALWEFVYASPGLAHLDLTTPAKDDPLPDNSRSKSKG